MFTKGTIVYFKNPINFGRIVEDTEIGPRWALGKDCELTDTVPIIAAIAGVLKNKFEVIKEVNTNDEPSGANFVILKSVDLGNIEIIASPKFIADGGSSSTILSNNERKLLLYLSNLLVEDAMFDEEEDEFADPGVSEELIKEIEEEAEKPVIRDVDQCASCGKCGGHGNSRKTLEQKAEDWENTYRRRRNAREEEGPDTVDFDELVAAVAKEVTAKLCANPPKPARRQPTPQYIESKEELMDMLGELFGTISPMRSRFGKFF